MPPKSVDGFRPKNLLGVPWRLAFALQDDGWYLRQDIIWSKPNPMPESVRDRCTKAHEYIFLLSKSERYFYDQAAIREPGNPLAGGGTVPAAHRLTSGGEFKRKVKVPGGWDTGAGGHATIHRNGRTEAEYTEAEISDGRNKRSVWTIATAPYPEAHFATFPKELPRTCILAGCPAGGTVLDPFGGSGTTGEVALELGRQALLIELNPEYAKLIGKRLCSVTPALEGF